MLALPTQNIFFFPFLCRIERFQKKWHQAIIVNMSVNWGYKYLS